MLKAGAHWADSPWRPANNVNETGLPEPPPYVGDKRIFLAERFYDVSKPQLRQLHRNYIRQCLNNFAGQHNVIQLISAKYSGLLSFVQFWLDTCIEWEQETGRDMLIGLSCPKDVQDAILDDPTRTRHINVIDIRYWTYTADGQLYAPIGGQNLSPRQHLRRQKPTASSFASIVRAVRECRTKFPDKFVTYYADLYCRSGRDGWAVLMGGGSLANAPSLPDELAGALVRMKPSDELTVAPQHWCLADGKREFLIYSASRDAPTTIQLPPGIDYEFVEIDPATGRVGGSFESVQGGTLKVTPSKSVIWVRH